MNFYFNGQRDIKSACTEYSVNSKKYSSTNKIVKACLTESYTTIYAAAKLPYPISKFFNCCVSFL